MPRSFFVASAVVLCGVAAQLPTATHSSADTSIWIFPGVHLAASPFTLKYGKFRDPVTYGWTETEGMLLSPGEGQKFKEAAAAAAPAIGKSGTYKLANFGGDPPEDGEPTLGGRMNKTIWMALKEPAARRVVVHTYGTDIDTVLAAYRGRTYPTMKRVALNDDHAGFGQQSLIQFDTKASTAYSVQIGSKSGDEDYIYVTATVFPPRGGLSAFLATTAHAAFNREYVCQIPNACIPTNFEPEFLLHNSTDKPMQVTASSDLGPGVIAPAPFSLAPGEVKTRKFKYGGRFDQETVRTIAGHFTFTGRSSGEVVSVASHPALIVVKPGFGEPAPLKVSVDAQVRANQLGVASVFQLDVENTGAETVHGCHARADSEDADIAWRRVNRDTNAFIGAINAPFSIPAGETRTIRVAIHGRTAYFADPRFNGIVDIDCADTLKAVLDPSNNFGITNLLHVPADLIVQPIAPKNGVLSVPAGGDGSFRVRAMNAGPTTKVSARATYDRPFDDPADTVFTVKICETNKNGVCLDPPSAKVSFTAEKNKLKYFKAVVSAPDGDPVFDPSSRRIFLLFEQPQSKGSSVKEIVGAESVAVRKKN